MNFDRNCKPIISLSFDTRNQRLADRKAKDQSKLDAIKSVEDCSQCAGIGQVHDEKTDKETLCKCVTKQIDKVICGGGKRSL